MRTKTQIVATICALLAGLLSASCGKKTSASAVNSDEDAFFLNNTSPEMRILPETWPTKSVLVSEYVLFDRKHPFVTGSPEIADGILKSGAELHVITEAPKSFYAVMPDFFSTLRNLAQKYKGQVRFIPASLGNKKEWLRDFGPITARSSNGKPMFIDFKYYVESKKEDQFPVLYGKKVGIKTFSSALKLEGGNFMIDEFRTCVVSKKFSAENTTSKNDLKSPPYNCRQLLELDPLPYEATGHIDLFVKFMGNKVVLVGNFLLEKTNPIDPSLDFDAAKYSQHLEGVQQLFRNQGYKVVKVPMPAPYKVAFDSLEGLEPFQINTIQIRSYINSLLISKNGKGIALVPRFQKQFIRQNPARVDADGRPLPRAENEIYRDYADKKLLAGYENMVIKAYRDAGFEVLFIPSDHLVHSSGSVHCLTMQIPDTSK